jgi:hypothetical protein
MSVFFVFLSSYSLSVYWQENNIYIDHPRNRYGSEEQIVMVVEYCAASAWLKQGLKGHEKGLNVGKMI